MNFSMRFVMLGRTRRKEPKTFSTGTLAFFSNCSVSNNLSGLWELTFLLATKLLEYFVEINKIVMYLCKARYYEKKKRKSVFFTLEIIKKIAFFKKNSPNGFIGLNEVKLYIGEKGRETFWDVLNCWLKFLKLHKTGKKAKRFFHRKNRFFSNNCVFNSIRGDTRKRRPKLFFHAELRLFLKKILLTCIGLEKPSYDFYEKFQKLLCPLFNCYLITLQNEKI